MHGEVYRGFVLYYEYPPIPMRQFDWIAVDENSDGLVVANGKTIEECRADVDRYIEEQE